MRLGLIHGGASVLSVLVLAGCPIFPVDGDDDYYPASECYDDSDCPSGDFCGLDNECHPENPTTGGSGGTGGTGGTGGSGAGGTGGAGPVYCGNPDDCAPGETCGPDGTCQTGDCSTVGCIFGFLCNASADPPVCIPENPNACGADADCVSPGDKCVSGVCTSPADQCFDQTQCPTDDLCVEGKCVPSCANDTDCPMAYECSALGICTEPAEPCTITNDCGSAIEVCVDGACVPRAPNGECEAGFVWVENGCIPEQSATFTCVIDGQQDLCALGSICLHHSCYISCATPNTNACDALASFDECKTVSTQSGEHAVCGSDENLGGECDPTAGISCNPGLICIDGFCR